MNDGKASLIKAVHCSARYRFFYRDDRQEWEKLLTESYGVKSSKDLGVMQLRDLLDYCNLKKTAPSRIPVSGKTAPGAIRLATASQLVLIDRLKEEVRWRAEDGFARWLAASFGLDRIRTSNDAHKIIEGLKGLKKGDAA
jgi:hypothetical protein